MIICVQIEPEDLTNLLDVMERFPDGGIELTFFRAGQLRPEYEAAFPVIVNPYG